MDHSVESVRTWTRLNGSGQFLSRILITWEGNFFPSYRIQ